MTQNLSSAAVMIGVFRVKCLTLCMLGNFSCFLRPLLTFFSKLTFSKNKHSGTLSVYSHSLDPDKDQHTVGPDLGPN